MCCQFRVVPKRGGGEAIRALLLERYPDLTAEAYPGMNSYHLLKHEDVTILVSIRTDEALVYIDHGVKTWQDHVTQAIPIALAAKAAASLAQALDGTLYQEATVPECTGRLPRKSNLVANYPDNPLNIRRLCPGFLAAWDTPS